jgi:hypothetical protein
MALLREEVEKGLTSCLAPPESAGQRVAIPALVEALVVQVTRDELNTVNVRLTEAISDGTWPAKTRAVYNASQVELGSHGGQYRFIGCLGWTVWKTRGWIPERTDCRRLGLPDAHGHLSVQLAHSVRSDGSLSATVLHPGGQLFLKGPEFDGPVSVDPGVGQIVVQRDGYRPWRDTFEATLGVQQELRPSFYRRPLWPALAAGGASALSLGVGVVSSFQLRTSSAKVDDFIDTCASGCNWNEGKALDREARSDRTRQNVSYLLSALFLAGAAAYWYFAL